MTAVDKKILIGMPSGSGLVHTSMLQSLLQLIKPYPAAFMVIERQRVDKARNAIAVEALKQGFDYLFFIDDDNPVPPDTLIKFMEDDKDVVIAPILGRNPDKNGKYKLCAFYATEHMVDGGLLKLYEPIETFKEEGYLHQIDAGGTGCMLIKKNVLQKMFDKHGTEMFEFGDVLFKKPLEVDGRIYKRRTMSEDCEFSERVIKLGGEIWLDDRVNPIHLSGLQSVQWRKE